MLLALMKCWKILHFCRNYFSIGLRCQKGKNYLQVWDSIQTALIEYLKLTTDTKLCFKHISSSLASSRKCLSNIDTYCYCTMESIRSKICQICNFHQICPICVTRGGTWWFKPATHILTWTLGQDVIIRRTIWVCGVSLNDKSKEDL